MRCDSRKKVFACSDMGSILLKFLEVVSENFEFSSVPRDFEEQEEKMVLGDQWRSKKKRREEKRRRRNKPSTIAMHTGTSDRHRHTCPQFKLEPPERGRKLLTLHSLSVLYVYCDRRKPELEARNQRSDFHMADRSIWIFFAHLQEDWTNHKASPDSSIAGFSPSSRCSGDKDGFLLPEFNELVRDFHLAATKTGFSPKKDELLEE
ncbi:hypothetical protein RHSIM_Rhsim10G0120600 [Rhododendron simsii]|uniref:Uncharacterized protein n=1 Tax=Rhododendron simsii TaxID=118357 RepID=A0A834GDI2_RHOSS|nr:hypothetical protein RHSIM_Rhsim10G0120600 [Rhododendron simsii]